MTEILVTSSVLIVVIALLRLVLRGKSASGCSMPCGCWWQSGCWCR